MSLRKKFSCQFPNCSNGYYWCKGGFRKVQNKHFYRFPTNPVVNVQWKKICDINLIENCRNKYVCEDHFQKKDFVNFTRHALNPFVVPSQIHSDSNLLPIEISTSLQDDSEVTNYCQPFNSVNSLATSASNDLNSMSTISRATTDNISNRIDSNIASEDAPPANLNVEQNFDTHFKSDNSNNISDTINLNNFSKQDCICENANCQRNDNNDIDDTIVTDNLTECNAITSILLKREKTGFLTEVGIFESNDTKT